MCELTNQEIEFVLECLWDSHLGFVVQMSNGAKNNNNEKIDEFKNKLEFLTGVIDKLTPDKQEEAKIDSQTKS